MFDKYPHGVYMSSLQAYPAGYHNDITHQARDAHDRLDRLFASPSATVGSCASHPCAWRARHAAAARQRSGLRHERQPGNLQAPRRSMRARPIISARAGCRDEIRGRPQPLSLAEKKRRPQSRAGRHDLYLPDASRKSARKAPAPARSAAWRWSRRLVTADAAPQSRAGRHDAALLDAAGAGAAGVPAGDGRRIWRACTCSAPRCRTGCNSCWRRRSCSGPDGRFSSAAGSRCVTRNLNMFTLIAMGTGVAWVYSVAATLAPGLFPDALRESRRRGAGLFRGRRRHHRAGAARPGAGAAGPRATGGAIRALLDLAPKTARRIAR